MAADIAILYQVVISIIGDLAVCNPSLVAKILSELDDLVDRMENDSPPNDPGIAELRRSLESFRKIVS